MQTNRTEFLLKKKTTNLQCVLNKLKSNEFEPMGGILKNGQLGWIGLGPHLDIVSLKSGNKVAEHTFQIPNGTTNALITCVVEIEIPDVNTLILAIGLQYFPIGGMICLFSVCGSRILRCIEMIDKVTCCRFVPPNLYKRTGIQFFDGCLVVGTDVGKVFFIDIYLKKCKEVLFGSKCNGSELDLTPCQIVLANVETSQLKSIAKHTKRENLHLAIGLEVVENSGSVLSLLLIPQQLTLVVGLDDGRMILYDLTDLQAYHLAYPPENYFPLINLAYIEPADDPRACIYVWAFHNNNNQSSVAVMHSIMFESKKLKGTEWIYDKFISCSVRLTIPFTDEGCKPISCQGITKNSTHEEEIISLCLLTLETSDNKINMLVFDLNQWYKEQMPDFLNINKLSNCLAYFTLGETNALDVWMDVKSVTPFSSVQRPEEHFYPNALSFECLLFTGYSCDFVYWPGLQNKVLDLLNTIGPKAVYEPDNCYNAIMNAALIPCFWEEYNFNVKPSNSKKRELIMTIALEYNCIGLLKKCATLWSDGSHLGDDNSYNDGVSLSTLTDWIWSHSVILKDYCNLLCLPLFDHSERQIDSRTQKQLSHCSRQLLLLSDLLEYILINCRNYIPTDVRETLQYQENSIRMAFDYQEVLQWLVNIGLLPESVYNPYPYTLLNNFYRSQRYKFSQNKTSPQITTKSALNSCNLFIDSFIKYEFNDKELKNQWKESRGLYPPMSLQEMLRILLVPNIKIENKYILILYLFLDLSIALDEERHGNIIENLIKFPSVFNLNPSVIKRTQAFWKLDHGQFEAALDELFSPLSGNNNLIYWQHELLIETLLHQDAPSLALQALRSQSTTVNSLLEIKTLLANGFVSEAFDVQRLKGDVQLLREFYRICFNTTKWVFILKLALTESEGRILCEYLKEIDTNSSEIFHVIYLLQRSKYMEAVDFINKLEKTKNTNNILETETSKLILSAYNLTMTPTVKTITKSYLTFCERSKNTKINQNPLPFSTKLIQNKIDITNGIYQRVFDSIADCDKSFLNGSIKNVPFIRKSIKDRDLLFRNNSDLIVPKLIMSGGGKNNENTNKRRLSSVSSSSIEDYPILKKPHMEKSIINTNKNSRMSLLTNFKDKKSHNTMIFNSTLNESLRSIDNKNVKEFGKNYLTDRLNESNSLLMKTISQTTHQSILKQQPEEVPPSSSSSTTLLSSTKITPLTSTKVPILKKIDSDEKSIKFNISESFNSSTGSSYLGPTKRASIRLSDISCRSSSIDEFYSPDNSKFDNEINDNPEECVTPPILIPEIIVEMENDEIVEQVNEVEEKNEINIEKDNSPKPIDIPLKRRALRSSSKTPERKTRGRSKTPETILTPYRKSIRLMEKSAQQESSITTIHNVIIEEEEENDEREDDKVEKQNNTEILLLDETFPDNNQSSFIVPIRKSVLTDESMLESDEHDIILETSRSDLDLTSVKKKIIFEEDEEDEAMESESEPELNVSNLESINENEEQFDSDNQEQDDEEEEVDDEDEEGVEDEENDENDYDDDIEKEEIVVHDEEEQQEEIDEEEQQQDEDDDGVDEGNVEEEQDEEQEDEDDGEEEFAELNTSLEAQPIFSNNNDESQSSTSTSSSSTSSQSSALSEKEDDVINILSSSEEEEDLKITNIKNSEDKFEEEDQEDELNKSAEQESDTEDVQTNIDEDGQNRDEIQLKNNDNIPIEIEHQLDVTENIEEIPVYHQMESADDVSAMLYDNIDFEMEEPDNMNNALIINFNYSQESSHLKNMKTTMDENDENIQNNELPIDMTVVSVSDTTTDPSVIIDETINDPMNEAQIISFNSSQNENIQNIENIDIENKTRIEIDSSLKTDNDISMEDEVIRETSLIIEDQSIVQPNLLNTKIIEINESRTVNAFETKEKNIIELTISDDVEINESDSDLLNKNIEIEESEEKKIIIVVEKDKEEEGDLIVDEVEEDIIEIEILKTKETENAESEEIQKNNETDSELLNENIQISESDEGDLIIDEEEKIEIEILKIKETENAESEENNENNETDSDLLKENIPISESDEGDLIIDEEEKIEIEISNTKETEKVESKEIQEKNGRDSKLLKENIQNEQSDEENWNLVVNEEKEEEVAKKVENQKVAEIVKVEAKATKENDREKTEDDIITTEDKQLKEILVLTPEIKNIEVGYKTPVHLETAIVENLEIKQTKEEKLNIESQAMRITRARSASTETQSMSKTLEDSPMPLRRTKRSNSSTSSSIMDEKKMSLKVELERIDENLVSTPTRMTRRSSLLALDKTPTHGPTISTPKKTLTIVIEDLSKKTSNRRRSVSIDKESNSSYIDDADANKNTRRSSSRLGTPLSKVNEDMMKTPKRKIDNIEIEQSPDNEEAVDYSTTRRLTRHQRTVMDKMAKYKNSPSASKKTRSAVKKDVNLDESYESEDDAAFDSETESNVSNSTIGTSASTRSQTRKQKQIFDDKMSDTSSVGSSKSKRGRPRKVPILENIQETPLPVIQEDSEDDVEGDKPKRKKGRPRKNSTSSKISTTSTSSKK